MHDVAVVRPRIPTIEIFRRRSAWGSFFGHFCGNYLNYFLLMWLPYYLVRERGFSMREMAVIGGVMYGFGALAAIASGSLADRWINQGASPTLARKTFTAGGLVLAAMVLLTCIIAGPRLSIALLILLGGAFGACGSNVFAIAQTLAGPHVVGRWVGIKNCLGNLSGIVAPAVTGVIVNRTGHFGWALATCAAFALMGAASYTFIVGRVEQIRWNADVPAAASTTRSVAA